MTEEDRHTREKRIVFVLAGLLLAAVISISFYHLDRHPAFMEPTDEFVEQLDQLEPNVVFANDPVALAAAERQRTKFDADLRATTAWPPEGTVFAFGSSPRQFEHAKLERVGVESVWSIWQPTQPTETPRFATAHVEVEDAGGNIELCPRDAEGHHQCGNAGWTRVGTREITVDGTPTRCIWTHPMEAKTIRVVFPNPTIISDGDRQLYFETALRDAAVGPGTPVEFEVYLDDLRTSHRHPDRRGWTSTSLPEVGELDELIVEVSAEDDGRRHACFRFNLR